MKSLKIRVALFFKYSDVHDSVWGAEDLFGDAEKVDRKNMSFCSNVEDCEQQCKIVEECKKKLNEIPTFSEKEFENLKKLYPEHFV